MFETFLVMMSLAAASGCFWAYWSLQKAEKRISENEETVRAKAILVGELADEIVMASQYLYEAMDSCLARIESVDPSLNELVVPPLSEAQATSSLSPKLVVPPMSEPELASGQSKLVVPPLPEAQTMSLAPEPVEHQSSESVSNLTVEPLAGPSFSDELKLAAESEGESMSAFDIPAVSASGNDSLTPDGPGADAADLVERARRMGMGVEELRLQLRFQDNQAGAGAD